MTDMQPQRDAEGRLTDYDVGSGQASDDVLEHIEALNNAVATLKAALERIAAYPHVPDAEVPDRLQDARNIANAALEATKETAG